MSCSVTIDDDTTETQTSTGKKGNHIGAIVGGTVGGVVGLAAILFAIFYRRRRRQQSGARPYGDRPWGDKGPLADTTSPTHVMPQPLDDAAPSGYSGFIVPNIQVPPSQAASTQEGFAPESMYAQSEPRFNMRDSTWTSTDFEVSSSSQADGSTPSGFAGSKTSTYPNEKRLQTLAVSTEVEPAPPAYTEEIASELHQTENSN